MKAKVDKNGRGNLVYRGFIFNGDRYRFDFKLCTEDKGWEPYDTKQDAYYFGIWVNRKSRKIMTYCEGDTILVDCPTEKSFKAELSDMDEFYGKSTPSV